MEYIQIFSFICAIPTVIWIGSYLYLAIYYRRWNLMKVLTHESGRYTLLGTIFYFNHFLRELFLDTFLVLTIYWTYRQSYPLTSSGEPSEYFTYTLITLLAFLGFTIIGSLRAVGLKDTLLDLFQFRERDTAVSFGAHWQMHFMSTLALMSMIILPATFQGLEEGGQLAMIFIGYSLLSLSFKTGVKAVRDRRWLLHGARELLTFVPLIVLPSYALNFQWGSFHLNAKAVVVLGFVGIVLLYYFLTYLGSDVRGLAQGDFGIAYLIASHFFEHILDFIYISLFVALLVFSRA